MPRPNRNWINVSNACLCAALALALAVSWNWVNAEAYIPRPGDAQVAAPTAWNGDLTPITAADWNYARAAHLLERAGFGGTPEEIHLLASLTPDQAVERLVNYSAIDNGHLPPFQESGILDPGMRPYTEENEVREAINDGHSKGMSSLGVKVLPEGNPLRLQPLIDAAYYHKYADALEHQRMGLWWANRMLATNRPLEEKIALFWHDHFATNYERVGDYRKTQIYLETLRKHATGNFRDFVVAIAQDPCMLVYLDNGLNVKGHANENFAREVLELFTMGEGRGYTEQDIREAARAFTGWTQDDITFVIKQDLHDTDNKTIFGKTENFDGISAIDLIMEQPSTALYITEKLYKYLVDATIPAGVNEQLARQFRDAKYELKPILRTIFLSKDFYSSHAYATQIKTPTHLVVSTCKKLGLTEIPGEPAFSRVSVLLGQELLAPPNVAGWEGDRSWINPATLLERTNYIHGLLGLTTPNRDRAAREVAATGGRQRSRPAASPAQMAAPEQMSAPGETPARQTGGAMSMPGEMAAPTGGGMQMRADDDQQPNRYAPTEEYVLRTGVQRGRAKANRRVLPTPRTKAELNLVAVAQSSGAKSVDELVDYFVVRFLRVPLDAESRQTLIDFVRTQVSGDQIDYNLSDLEAVLRELTHLIMSTPEYQLS